MGFFSWVTQDTGKSISNIFSHRKTFPVIMTDDKGNTWKETYYDGYGSFDGKDFYALVDEMNGGTGDRDKGIAMAFGKDSKNYKFPSLSEDGKYYGGEQPENCEYQGYFYGREDFDDEY